VRLWGATTEDVETIFDALVRALEAEASGAWSYSGGDWARAGALSHGEAMTCTITLGAHVIETPSALVTITSARPAPSLSPSAPGDGEISLGEP